MLFGKKHYYLLLVLLGLAPALRAQIEIARQVIPTSMISSDRRGNNYLRFTATVGETAVGTFIGRKAVTMGFQQPDIDGIVPVIEIDAQAIEVLLYPNPVTERLTVEWGQATGKIERLTLIDAQGRIARTISVDTTAPTLTIGGLQEFPSGLYTLRATQGSGQIHELGKLLFVTR